MVSHGALALTAQGDIKNLSGIINGGSVFLNSVHGDIVNETLLQSINQRIHGGDLNMSVASRVASISSSNGSVILKARDINNTGADLRSKNGSVILNASRDIHINALKEKRDFLDTHGKRKETSHRDSYTLSHIDTDGHTLQIQAGHDANLEAVQIKSKNSYVIAKNKVNITAVVDSDYTYKSKKKKKYFGLQKKKSIDETRFESVIGTTIDTDNLVISGDNGVGLESAKIHAQSAALIAKNGDVDITAKAYRTQEYHERKKSGISLGLSGGRLTFAEKTKNSNSIDKLTHQSSNIETGSLYIKSGNDTNIIGSNIVAGNMVVDAKNNFNVLDVRDIDNSSKKHSKTSIGIELTLNSKEVSVFAGAFHDTDGDTLNKSMVHSSNIVVGNMAVTSKTTNVLGSNIVGNNIMIDSENINVLSDHNEISHDNYDTSMKVGVKVGAKQHLSDAINAVTNTDSVASGLKAYDAVQSAAANPISGGIDVIYEESGTKGSEKMSQVVGSTIMANNSLTLNAKNHIQITGSDVGSANQLNVNAKTLTMQADQSTYTQNSSNINKNASVGIYGTNAGQVSVGYQSGYQTTTGVTQRNATLTAGGSGSINVSGDMTMTGANVQVGDLDLAVGGNLNMTSLQDTQTITGSSKGGSISAGAQGLSGLSVNKGSTSGNKAWVETQTGINASNSAHINVNGSTSLTGAYIANMDEDGIDKGNLNFNSDGLILNDIQDIDTFESENIGVGVHISYDDKNTQYTDESGKGGSIDYSNSTIDKAQTTKATIGDGNINVGTTIGALNRDVSNIQEITKDKSDSTDFYMSDQTVALATNPTGELSKLATNINNLPTKIQEESSTIMPSATDEDEFYAALGKIVDNLSDALGGILPSDKNNGGILGNLPVWLGAGDIHHKVIQVKSKNMLTDENKDEFVPMKESEYYKSASPETQKKLDTLGDVYVSKEPITIDASNVTYQNGTNGMLNDEGLAISNVVTQTHTDGDTNINVTLNYNPTHGFVGDIIESAIDKNGGTTGIAKQTGEFMYDVTAVRPDANFANHSQGNIVTYSGVQYINDNGGFKFGINPLYNDDGKAIKPTVVGFGSPISYSDMKKLLEDDGFEFIGNYTNPNDYVGEGVGGNSGDNGSATILQRLNLYNAALLFDLPLLPPSPHSTYHCDPSKGHICGDR